MDSLDTSLMILLVHRTTVEIQRKVIRQDKRNAASRLVHAKNDKEMIVTWRSDLARVLLIFNVCGIISVWLSLTLHSQTELAISTHTTVSDIHHNTVDTLAIASNTHHDVLNAHAIISDIQQSVVNTQAIVSNIHQTMVEGQEGANGQKLLVGITCTPFVAE